MFLPVSSILARLPGWSGSLNGASPLNPSWGHGGGLGSCTSGQSGVGHTEWGGARHRWAEEEGLESILQVTGKTNTYSSFKEETLSGWGNRGWEGWRC